MTIQALVFMHQIHKVQRTEDGTVWLDEENKKMITVAEENLSNTETVYLSKKWGSVRPMLHYLQMQKLLDMQSLDCFHLTYDGYHYWQTFCTKIINFLLTSVGIPIVVSFLTTIIALWLEG